MPSRTADIAKPSLPPKRSAQARPKSVGPGTDWAPEDVRDAVVALESVYGSADPHPRYEPVDELVSCILTQHTSDANAYPAFERLRKKHPTWESVAALSQGELADEIRSAGLANQKARSILSCLAEIRSRNGGYTLDNLRDMPMREGRDWLMALPGVGPKTASIVLCFAFGKEAIPVDTHVYRVSVRMGLVPEGCGEAKAHDLLLDLVPLDLAFPFHVALIRHGRQVCRAPLPLCDGCAVRARCKWLRDGGPERRRNELKRSRAARKLAGGATHG